MGHNNAPESRFTRRLEFHREQLTDIYKTAQEIITPDKLLYVAQRLAAVRALREL